MADDFEYVSRARLVYTNGAPPELESGRAATWGLPSRIRFADVGKSRDPGRRGPTRRLDYLERELAGAQGSHHEPPPLVGRVSLVVAPTTEGHEVLEVEV